MSKDEWEAIIRSVLLSARRSRGHALKYYYSDPKELEWLKSGLEDMTPDSKPWIGNEVKPFTEETFIASLRKSGPLGDYWASEAEKILKEKRGKK